jgi:hypothetical protein
VERRLKALNKGEETEAIMRSRGGSERPEPESLLELRKEVGELNKKVAALKAKIDDDKKAAEVLKAEIGKEYPEVKRKRDEVRRAAMDVRGVVAKDGGAEHQASCPQRASMPTPHQARTAWQWPCTERCIFFGLTGYASVYFMFVVLVWLRLVQALAVLVMSSRYVRVRVGHGRWGPRLPRVLLRSGAPLWRPSLSGPTWAVQGASCPSTSSTSTTTPSCASGFQLAARP